MKVALVTGGGTGIGAAIARRLSADGYSVAVTGRRPGPIEDVAAEIGGLAVAADTGVETDAERAVQETVERFGGLDALVCNAGIGGEGSLRKLDPATWDEVIRTNLTGAFLMCRAAIDHLAERHGSVVTISSAAGLRASPESLAYCSSKAGLQMLTQCLAVDHGPEGVRVNCVAPGLMEGTRMTSRLRPELADGARQRAVLKRAASVEDVADQVAAFCRTDSVTGQVLNIDGGVFFH